ncbi:hypothetical protein ACFQU2_26685 [Siccirubricoccus deserti]
MPRRWQSGPAPSPRFCIAGALKSLPVLAALPVDLTLVALALLLPSLFLLLLVRRWHVSAALALPLLGAGLLPFWLVLAGAGAAPPRWWRRSCRRSCCSGRRCCWRGCWWALMARPGGASPQRWC